MRPRFQKRLRPVLFGTARAEPNCARRGAPGAFSKTATRPSRSCRPRRAEPVRNFAARRARRASAGRRGRGRLEASGPTSPLRGSRRPRSPCGREGIHRPRPFCGTAYRTPRDAPFTVRPNAGLDIRGRPPSLRPAVLRYAVKRRPARRRIRTAQRPPGTPGRRPARTRPPRLQIF